MTTDGDGKHLRTRYNARELVTQSLTHAAALQDCGWGCIFVGASFLIAQQRKQGLVARMQRPRVIDVGLVHTVARQLGLTRVVIEAPCTTTIVDTDNNREQLYLNVGHEDVYTKKIEARGFDVCDPVAHTKTQIVDLACGLDSVVAGYASVARRNTRKAIAADVTYEIVPFADVTEGVTSKVRTLDQTFRASRPWLHDQASYRHGLVTHFGDRGWFSLAWQGRELLGVVYMLTHDRVAYYHTAYSAPQGRSMRVPTGLVYTSMREAIRRGCDLFDFVGLYDARYPDRYPRWQGFSTFKRRFGGVSVEYPPSFEIPVPEPLDRV